MPTKPILANEDVDFLGGPKDHPVVDTSLLLEELRRRYVRKAKPIEVDFRKLVNWIRLGDQLTHQIHPYPAKLLPQIAHFFIRASYFNGAGKIVLDPFCGSGTVALEASLAGHLPMIADANPLALLIARVKTTPYETIELSDAAQKIVSKARRFKHADEIPVVNGHLWYDATVKKNLEILLRAINCVSRDDHKDFFRVCFSVVSRRLSRADPAISVPVRLKTKDRLSNVANQRIKERQRWLRSADVLAEFKRVCDANISRVQTANFLNRDRCPAIEVGRDARNLQSPGSKVGGKLQDESVSLILTSPPYGSAQKYIRAASLSLNWLGLAAPTELAMLEGRSIGREHLPRYAGVDTTTEIPQSFERLVARITAKNERRGQITRQYLCEMKAALVEMVRVCSKQGHIVLVVGNNQVCGKYLHNDKFIVHILEELGMKLEMSLIDHIKSRGLITKRNKTASVISRESVLVFSKQAKN